jgi:hypothetical protein
LFSWIIYVTNDPYGNPEDFNEIVLRVAVPFECAKVIDCSAWEEVATFGS